MFPKPVFHNDLYFIFFLRLQWLVPSSNEPVTTIPKQISTKDKQDNSKEICHAG